jgi:hypothetical protein
MSPQRIYDPNERQPDGRAISVTGIILGSGLPSDRAGQIYFIRCADFIKIGFTGPGPINSRINNMRTGNPFEIELLKVVKGSRRREAKIHAKFASAKHRGEWFHATDELVAYIGIVR